MEDANDLSISNLFVTHEPNNAYICNIKQFINIELLAENCNDEPLHLYYL